MKCLLACFIMILSCGLVSGGECPNGKCSSRTVVVKKEIVRNFSRPLKKSVNKCENGVCRSRTVTVVR